MDAGVGSNLCGRPYASSRQLKLTEYKTRRVDRKPESVGAIRSGLSECAGLRVASRDVMCTGSVLDAAIGLNDLNEDEGHITPWQKGATLVTRRGASTDYHV